MTEDRIITLLMELKAQSETRHQDSELIRDSLKALNEDVKRLQERICHLEEIANKGKGGLLVILKFGTIIASLTAGFVLLEHCWAYIQSLLSREKS